MTPDTHKKSSLTIRRRNLCLEFIECNEQRRDAVCRGPPVSQTLIVVDEPIERALYGDERCRGLRELSQRHGAVQILWYAENPGNDRRKKEVAVRDKRDANELPTELTPP
jgi:hypothetical protein